MINAIVCAALLLAGSSEVTPTALSERVAEAYATNFLHLQGTVSQGELQVDLTAFMTPDWYVLTVTKPNAESTGPGTEHEELIAVMSLEDGRVSEYRPRFEVIPGTTRNDFILGEPRVEYDAHYPWGSEITIFTGPLDCLFGSFHMTWLDPECRTLRIVKDLISRGTISSSDDGILVTTSEANGDLQRLTIDPETFYVVRWEHTQHAIDGGADITRVRELRWYPLYEMLAKFRGDGSYTVGPMFDN